MKTENSSPPPSDSKRKRDADEEIEINLDAPEPASKKAKRKEQKSKSFSSTTSKKDEVEQHPGSKLSPTQPGASAAKSNSESAQPAQKRSAYGIWIGNLPFTATKETVRNFLIEQGGIDEKDVTRLHLPTTSAGGNASGAKAGNKGFAYVDFASEPILATALGLSERMFGGRRVLIKDAKSFEGRPEKAKDESTSTTSGKTSGRDPTKKVFVGNLGFDVTKEDLGDLFGQAGEVEDIFMATFQDSGKCKGYAWLRFATLEAAAAAVQGFVYKTVQDNDKDDVEGEDSDASGTASGKKKRRNKPRKHFINRLQGRQLRCEFAEDAQTRYSKRFGKDAKAAKSREEHDGIVEVDNKNGSSHGLAIQSPLQPAPEPTERKAQEHKAKNVQPNKDQRREDRRRRHEKLDARAVAPGKALATTQRSSGAIVAGEGKKMVFDD